MPQHPPMIYRVHGVRADGGESFVDIECRSEAVARNVAIRNGLVSTNGVEVVSRDLAVDPVRPATTTRTGGQRIVTEHAILAAEAFKAGFFLAFGVLAALFVVWIGKTVLEVMFVAVF